VNFLPLSRRATIIDFVHIKMQKQVAFGEWREARLVQSLTLKRVIEQSPPESLSINGICAYLLRGISTFMVVSIERICELIWKRLMILLDLSWITRTLIKTKFLTEVLYRVKVQ